VSQLTTDEARLIADYLGAVEGMLPGTRCERQLIIDELYDGILEARSEHCRHTDHPIEATEQAIHEFGTPADVAMSHSLEFIIRGSQRTGGRATILLLIAGLVWTGFHAVYGVPYALVPDGSHSRMAFYGLTEAVQVVPAVTQLAAVALLIISTQISNDLAGARWVQRMSDILVVLLSISLATMVGILVLALPSWDQAFVALFTGGLLMGVIGGLLVDALLNSRRSRRIDAMPGYNESN
jgi:hypothetical protein